MTIVSPSHGSIDQAAKTLRDGGIVAFATETVYGLGCDTFNLDAINLVYATKGRPIHNPMIAHILDSGWVTLVTDEWNDQCSRLAEAFWPGPLTIVLPKKDNVPSSACGGRNTIAIRCPSHPVARQLLTRFNKPISAPSANKSGYVSPTTAKHVDEEFNGDVCVIDGGPCEEGIESTVLSLVGKPSILRPGTITQHAIEKIIGSVTQTKRTIQGDSPGTAQQHYAPLTNATLVTTHEINLVDDEHCVALAIFGNPQLAKKCIRMPSTPKEYGAMLYMVLREVDGESVSRIIIEQPPTTPHWIAIQDRLNRCTATG